MYFGDGAHVNSERNLSWVMASIEIVPVGCRAGAVASQNEALDGRACGWVYNPAFCTQQMGSTTQQYHGKGI